MPIITIQQSPRSTKQKQELLKRITKAFVDVYDIKEEQVTLFFNEYNPTSWGKSGFMNGVKIKEE